MISQGDLTLPCWLWPLMFQVDYVVSWLTLIGQAPQLQMPRWGSERKQTIQELLLRESAQAFRKQDETRGEWKGAHAISDEVEPQSDVNRNCGSTKLSEWAQLQPRCPCLSLPKWDLGRTSDCPLVWGSSKKPREVSKSLSRKISEAEHEKNARVSGLAAAAS